MIAALGAWAAKSALMSSPLGGLLKRIPRWAWIALAVALVLFLAVRWHSGRIEQLKTNAFNAGYSKAVDDGKKGVVKVEQTSTRIATEIRSTTNAQIRNSARHADDLRLRGPAAAACIDPRLSAGAGGRQPPGRGAGPAVARLPEPERPNLIAVPFDDAVTRLEIDDANRIELLAWREWHRRLTAEWERYRSELAKEPSK